MSDLSKRSFSMVGQQNKILQSSGDYRWDGVDLLPYKEDGTIFKSVTRQVLFEGQKDLPVEFRYFEVGPDGHSTLERHHHQHAVMIIRGCGHVLVGDTITPIDLHSVVHIPPMTWHQFRANRGDHLGFLCIVSTDRDRPQRPEEPELLELRSQPHVADFIRV